MAVRWSRRAAALATARRAGTAVLAAILAVALAGCGLQIPADPHGTLDRVTDGMLRVGVTDNDPWVTQAMSRPDGAAPGGIEPALVVEFADGLRAEVEWHPGSEAALVEALHRGELDMVIGGFLADTPWSDRGATTQPYATTRTAEGEQQHVMLVRMGENRFLTALDAFLLERTEPS